MNHMNNSRSVEAMAILKRMFAAEMQSIESAGTDSSAIADIFHPDIVVHEPATLPYAGDWQGHAGLKELFRTMHDTWNPMTVEDMNATIDGDRLFMVCTLVATARRSGQTIRQPFAEVLTIKDGLVIEGFPFYYDTAAINKALNP